MTNVNSPTPKIRSAAVADKSVAGPTISQKRFQNALRQELRRLLIRPVQELAGLRIARLDAMIERLVGRVLDRDLEAMNVVLTLVNTLGRLPAGAKAPRFEPWSEKVRARPARKRQNAPSRLHS